MMPSKLFSCFLCSYSIDKFHYVCDACYEILPWNTNVCCTCSLSLLYVQSQDLRQNLVCAKCRLVSPKFKILAPFKYDKIIAHIIRSIKYHGVVEVNSFLAEALINYILVNAYISKVDIMIPVPLFARRQKQRGFNQAIELAKAINKIIGIKIDCVSCTRVKNTPSQTKYNLIERQRNLHKAFIAERDFSGKRVVILDDVVTTGATVSALAEVIYGKGALTVEVWAIARANKV
jgi:ComF family protein